MTLRQIFDGSLLLLETRRLRKDLKGLRVAVERIATALELQNAHAFPQHLPATGETAGLEILHVDSDQQAEFMDIELRLTRARGVPPSEEEILAEYELRRSIEGQERPMNG